MNGSRAAAGSALFFALAPGVVVGVVPWWLTRWQPGAPRFLEQLCGVLLVTASMPLLISSFVRFVLDGRGTPAPVAPTERLVIRGAYRYVRNPMYVAVVAGIAGQALVLDRAILGGYAVIAFVVMALFVRFYEEPTLRAKYGAEYVAYCAAVPAWLPRWRLR